MILGYFQWLAGYFGRRWLVVLGYLAFEAAVLEWLVFGTLYH